MRLLCKLVVNDQLEEAEASNIIGLIKSATSPLPNKSLLQQGWSSSDFIPDNWCTLRINSEEVLR